MACTHIPIASDLHQHNIQLDSLDFDGVTGSTLALQQGTLCSLAVHSCQVALQLLPTVKGPNMSIASPSKILPT